MAFLTHSIPYQENSSFIFEKIKHESWAVFLDSGKPYGQYGRYDIIASRPFITITTMNGEATVTQADDVLITLNQDPFQLLKTHMLKYQQQAVSDLPFCGGAIGYFGYDIVRYLEDLPATAMAIQTTPEMSVGLYDWAMVVDHKTRTSRLVSYGLNPKTNADWDNLCAIFTAKDVEKNSDIDFFQVKSDVSSNMNFATYSTAFKKVKQYIYEGDCYQVNLAQRFSTQAQGNGWVAYKKLREISPAPFMAYLNYPQMQVICGSPERFLQINGTHVETRPIKGTRPRAEDAALDEANAQALQNSEKDRAENLMIVDLLRNDISKNCKVGSVQANQLFNLQSFANVHHLVSIVTGELAKGRTAIDLLKGCFPGGSITGAPKLRAMQIIEELEPHRRALYCGAIGYIGFEGNMDTNIAIRTAVYAQGEVSFYAGGGIVADSELEKEYKETWDKAASMLKLMSFFKVK